MTEALTDLPQATQNLTLSINEFSAYLAEWHRLEQEYYRIPSWRTFKQLKNIRQREKLTKAYEATMKQRGII